MSFSEQMIRAYVPAANAQLNAALLKLYKKELFRKCRLDMRTIKHNEEGTTASYQEHMRLMIKINDTFEAHGDEHISSNNIWNLQWYFKQMLDKEVRLRKTRRYKANAKKARRNIA